MTMHQDQDQARATEERALAIATRIAGLMGELDTLGFATAAQGRITGPGVEILPIGGQWTAVAAR